jgi:hypothetical protein
MNSKAYLGVTRQIVAQLSGPKSLFLSIKKPVNTGVS